MIGSLSSEEDDATFVREYSSQEKLVSGEVHGIPVCLSNHAEKQNKQTLETGP